jgi:hypothetical protein
MPNNTTPTNDLSADAENETLGFWLGQKVTRDDLESAAIVLFNETYGDVGNAKHGLTYTIWLDNNLSAEVTLERPRGKYVEPDGTVSALPILSVDYEAPCDVDDQDAVEEWGNYFEEQKESLIAGWVDEMIEALSETDDD